MRNKSADNMAYAMAMSRKMEQQEEEKKAAEEGERLEKVMPRVHGGHLDVCGGQGKVHGGPVRGSVRWRLSRGGC